MLADRCSDSVQCVPITTEDPGNKAQGNILVAPMQALRYRVGRLLGLALRAWHQALLRSVEVTGAIEEWLGAESTAVGAILIECFRGRHRGGGHFYLIFCSSPDAFFVQQNEPFPP